MSHLYNHICTNVKPPVCLTGYNAACSVQRMTLGQRLRQARKAAGLTQQELATRVGVQQQLISNIERDRQKETAYIVQLALACNVRPEWLAEERGPMVADIADDAPSYLPPVAEAPPLGPLSNVPVVGTTQGGAPDTIWLEEGYPVGYSDDVLDVPAKDRNAYALRVVGNSMSPRMREGDYIMIYPNQEAQPGDEVVVRTNKGEVMVKQLAYIRAGEVALDSIAKDHDRIVRKLEEIVYIHFVAGIHPAGALRKQT